MLPKYDWLYEKDNQKLESVRLLYRKYNSKKSVKLISVIFSENKSDEELTDMKFAEMDYIRDEIRDGIYSSVSSNEEFLYYCWQLSYCYSNFNWKFAWDILGEDIVECIESGDCFVPTRNDCGLEYLGSRYSLEKVKKEVDDD